MIGEGAILGRILVLSDLHSDPSVNFASWGQFKASTAARPLSKAQGTLTGRRNEGLAP